MADSNKYVICATVDEFPPEYAKELFDHGSRESTVCSNCWTPVLVSPQSQKQLDSGGYEALCMKCSIPVIGNFKGTITVTRETINHAKEMIRRIRGRELTEAENNFLETLVKQ